MAKIDFLRTPEDGNQRIVDGNFKASKALFVPDWSGSTLSLNGNNNEPGAIAFKDGAFYGYNGTAWGSLGGGSSYSFTNGLTNLSGVISLGGPISTNTNITLASGTGLYMGHIAKAYGLFLTYGSSSFTTSLAAGSETGSSTASNITLSGTGTITIGTTNSTGRSTQLLLDNGRVFSNSDGNSLSYNSDYSANYTTLSLIHKGYADSIYALKLLTGYASGAGTVSATDTVLQAIQKLNGNIALLNGAVVYQGTWNASTNTPTLTSSVGTKGFMYKVSVAGTTNLNGINTWSVGDEAIFDGSVWGKLVAASSEVVSFNTRIGAVTLTSSDVTTALGYTPIQLSSLTSTAPVGYNNGTGVISLSYGNGLSNVSGSLHLGGTLTDANTFLTVNAGNQLFITSANSGNILQSTFQVVNGSMKLYNTNTALSSSNAFMFVYFDVSNNPQAAFGTNQSSSTETTIYSTYGTGIIVKDNAFGHGIQYLVDYSSSYTNRSLVDKSYVDSKFLALGTANQFLSMNVAGTAQEYRTFNVSGGISILYGSGAVSMFLQDAITPPGDANFTASNQSTFYQLTVVLTANRTITLNTGSGYIGTKMGFMNKNATAFTWTFVTVVPQFPDGTNLTTLLNNTYYELEYDGSHWIVINATSGVAGGVGTTTNAVTFNNSGSGATSGSTFNGSAAINISYNSIGAAPLASPTFTGTVTIPNGAALGTPGSINLSNGTALPIANVSGLGTGIATFLATPTSANFALAVTGETGSGSVVFSISPTFTGTPLTPTATTGATGTQIASLDYVLNTFTAKTQFFATGTFTGAGTSGSPYALGQVVGVSQLTATGTASSSTYLRGDNTWATISGGGVPGNPTGSIGLTAVNGSSANFMRSDGTPALSQSIIPTWTGLHTFSTTNTAASGIGAGTSIAHTVNQTLTAGFIDLLVNRTNTAAGSGTQRLLDLQVGGSSLFNVNTAGGLTVVSSGATFNGTIQTFVFSTSATFKTDGLLLANNAASSAANPSLNSPLMHWQNSVWNTTTTAATNSVQFGTQSRGISGTTPIGQLVTMGYVGVSGTPTWTDLMSLDNSGNLSLLSGTLNIAGLTALKVVFTDGSKNFTSTGIGTSSQFIKGNGSLDSSIYLTANQTITLSGDITGSGATSIVTTIKSSVSLSGSPTATTATTGDNTTRIATCAFVNASIAASGSSSATVIYKPILTDIPSANVTLTAAQLASGGIIVHTSSTGNYTLPTSTSLTSFLGATTGCNFRFILDASGATAASQLILNSNWSEGYNSSGAPSGIGTGNGIPAGSVATYEICLAATGTYFINRIM